MECYDEIYATDMKDVVERVKKWRDTRVKYRNDVVKVRSIKDVADKTELKEDNTSVNSHDWEQYKEDTDSDISFEEFVKNYEKCEKCGYCAKEGYNCQCDTR